MRRLQKSTGLRELERCGYKSSGGGTRGVGEHILMSLRIC